MPLNAYLNFDGNTREVVLFYASVFGLEEPHFLTFGENSGEGVPPEAKDLIMHTRLEIAGGTLMFSDMFPGMEYVQGTNFSLAIVSKDEELIRNSFDKLKEGGSVLMELMETPWSKMYGSLTDKYGIAWQFSYDME